MCSLIYSLLILFLFSGFSRTCWGSSSVETVTVHPGENVTLPCTVPASLYMAWYQLTNDELRLILSVSRKNFNMHIFEDYNNDSSHFLAVAESSDDSVSLFISSVEQSDIGLYYCSGQPGGRYMLFGQAVHLTFPGVLKGETGVGLCWKLLIATVCILALALALCVSMLFCKVVPPSSFCMNCVKENTNLKAVDLQYASLRHPAKTQERQPAPAAHHVTYDTVAKKTTTDPV